MLKYIYNRSILTNSGKLRISLFVLKCSFDIIPIKLHLKHFN
ncbi:hypothetical protein BANRA_00895 [Klebsiella pneumoniae]|nr:hypothetical protein BANRA_02199 [Klebsiella pneumoniae]VCX21320.1 hypothetical protein BANRA_00895 [Klebsiella pneumoniae]